MAWVDMTRYTRPKPESDLIQRVNQHGPSGQAGDGVCVRVCSNQVQGKSLQKQINHENVEVEVSCAS